MLYFAALVFIFLPRSDCHLAPYLLVSNFCMPDSFRDCMAEACVIFPDILFQVLGRVQ